MGISDFTWLNEAPALYSVPSCSWARATLSLLLLRTNALESHGPSFIQTNSKPYWPSPHCCHPGPSHPPFSPGNLLTGPLVFLPAWAAYFLLWKYKWDSLLKTSHWFPTSLSESRSPHNSLWGMSPSTSWPSSYYFSPSCLLCFRHVGLLAIPKDAKKALTLSKGFLPLDHSPSNSWSGCSTSCIIRTTQSQWGLSNHLI